MTELTRPDPATIREALRIVAIGAESYADAIWEKAPQVSSPDFQRSASEMIRQNTEWFKANIHKFSLTLELEDVLRTFTDAEPVHDREETSTLCRLCIARDKAAKLLHLDSEAVAARWEHEPPFSDEWEQP